jgi:2-oxo-4-hydroxy-4-carboxy-5-ureidoimidazoline decarboxylase
VTHRRSNHTDDTPHTRPTRPIRHLSPRELALAGLAALNAASPADAQAVLVRCCASLRWARRVCEHRPYPDVDALLAAADEAGYDLTAADLAEALASEPALVPAPGREQSGGAARTALRAAHAAYESRFGHAFVICLDGVPAGRRLDHVLAGIRTRLGNEPEEERCVATEELRRLARARLRRMVTAGAEAGFQPAP